MSGKGPKKARSRHWSLEGELPPTSEFTKQEWQSLARKNIGIASCRLNKYKAGYFAL